MRVSSPQQWTKRLPYGFVHRSQIQNYIIIIIILALLFLGEIGGGIAFGEDHVAFSEMGLGDGIYGCGLTVMMDGLWVVPGSRCAMTLTCWSHSKWKL
ncbi:hypothetical protein VNO77_25226 [Canavalia gladiata]|uniref:Uncharacterized protein n=1 Tax=Canavalia gladiata TaxID=3824 RepID=A0AAN9L7Q6_CANGL